MSREKLICMIDCMKRLMREQDALAKHNAVSGNGSQSPARRNKAASSAVECAVEIRRLKHEAHCLAVELGIADHRGEAHYRDTTAPAGFGRVKDFSVRAPEVQS
ncbi:hypothetical protein [Herbaspirillum sp. RV1423]|uniref:hypothetical protein n=1 Tax=Herbaspirillum sp. RV1423 TaxID=1443993 RepID=UPI0004B3DAD3|nr:hypothetical protein [Herbaspirillum sp. RV1423]